MDETLGAYVLAAPAGGQGLFEIEVSDEISSWLNLSLTARSLDATLSDVSSNYAETAAVPLQIQFEATPKEPAVQFLPSALLSFNEDVAIPLTDVLTITPAGGRALKDVTVKLEFPTNNLELKVYRDGVDVTGQEIKLSTIADATGEVDLSRLTLQSVTHAKGTIDGITLTAFDTVSETGVSSTPVIATSGVLSVLPIADGVDSAALSASLSAGLVVGLGLSVELSDGNGGGFLGGLAKIDTSETVSIRLGFTGVTSADMAVKVGDRFLGATSATVDGNAGLYFSISEADLNGGEGISLVARNGFSSVQGGYVQAYTNDGGVLDATPVVVNFEVTIDADAIAPLTQANDIVGTESDAEGTGIAVPISIALNANRADFEKIGLIVTTSDSALEAGVFTVNDIDGNVLDDITFDTDSESWELFKDLTTQLDFDTVKFKAPSNYSGDSTFTVTPFAKTGTDTVEATSLELGMQIVASAEALALSTGTPSPLVLTEQGASFAHDDDSSTQLDLLGLLDTSALAAVGVDIDERLIFNVTVPDTLFVYAYTEAGGVQRLAYNEGATGNVYSLNRLLSDSSASEGLGFDQYYLSSTPYHAVSVADQLTVEIQTSEPSSGNSYTVGTVNIGYQVEAVANGTPAITLLKPTALISESSSANANAVKLSTVIDLASDVSYDDSETLSIFITADQREHLTLYERVGDIDTDITSDNTLAIAGVDKTGWLVDASKLPNLYIRGDDYFSSATPVSIQLRAVSAENDLPDLAPEISDAVDFSLTVKPVADGVTAFNVASNARNLDEYTPTGTRSGYEVGLDTLISGATMLDADGSESIFYKITLPHGELAFVNSASGTATMPKASVSADGKISYDVAAGQLIQYAIRGTLYNSSDDVSNGSAKGSFSIDVAAFTKESNGLTSSLSASETIALTLDPVAGQVFSSVPATVAGLDSGAGIALPIRAYTLDASETLSMSIAFSSPNALNALGQNDLSFFIGETPVVSGNGGFTVDFDDATKTTTLFVSAEASSSLKDLRVSSTKDFRLDDRLNVESSFTVADGNADPVDTVVSSRLGIYKALPEVAFEFTSDTLKGTGTAVVGFDLDRDSLMPAGIALSDVTILISDVPDNAYFVARDGGSALPIGASFEEIPGLWVLSAADLFRDGVWDPDEKLTLEMVGLNAQGINMSATAVVVDSLGGTSTTQASPTVVSTINLTGEGDPLIFSWNGDDIVSTAIASDLEIALDLDNDEDLELAQYWLETQDESAVAYSFLVRGDTVTVGTESTPYAIEMSDLYQTFGELVQDLNLDSPSLIAADQWGSTKLWTDFDADGQVDSGELSDAMPDGFELTLPAQQVLQDAGGGFQTLFEANVSYSSSSEVDTSETGKLFAVGIPYLEQMPAGDQLEGAFAAAPAVTVSFVTQAAAAAVIPEDAAGGPSFMVGLRKSVLGEETTGGTHLVALQISVFDESGVAISSDWTLSAGALKERDNEDGTTDAFWILPEASLDSTLRVLGLPEHFTGSIDVKATAYATATASGVPVSMVSAAYTQTLAIEGVADAPTLLAASGEIAWAPDEGGTLYLTTDGTQQGESVLGVFSPDAAESSYVQFTLSSEDTAGISVSGANALGGGVYEVDADALSGVVLTLADNYKTDFDIAFTALSKQNNTVAESSDTLTFSASVQHRADALVADTTTLALSKTSINEGAATDLAAVSFSTTLADASELVVHQVLVGSLSGDFSADSILGLSGYTELAPTLLDADYWSGVLGEDVADFDSAGWKLFQIESAVNEDGVFSKSGELELDTFYDGTLTVAQSAYTVELQNGDASVAQTNVQTLTVNPLVDSASTNIYFADSSGNAINSVVLTEGDTEGDTAGATFRIYASSSDSDEVLDLPDALTLPAGFSITSVADGEGFKTYQVVAQEGLSVTAGETPSVAAQVVVVDDTVSETANLTLDIALTKIATTPTFVADEVTDLAIGVIDGQRYATHGDATSGLGVYFELPTTAEASRSDDTLTYRLADIPKWMTLVTPVGSLVSSTETHYTLAFSEADLPSVRWKFDRDFLLSETDSDATATLQWVAVHTEASNFDSKDSDPVLIGVERAPHPTKPSIFGQTTFEANEGASTSYSLADYEISLGGFQAVLDAGQDDGATVAEIAAATLVKEGVSVELTVPGADTLGLSLSYTDSGGAAILQPLSGDPVQLTYDAFKSASIVFDNGADFNGSFDINLSVGFALGGTTRESESPLVIAVNVANEPEEVTSSVDETSVPDVDEGSFIALVTTAPNDGELGLAVTGYDAVNDDLSVLLKLNSEVQLYKSQSGGAEALVTAIDAEGDNNFYDVTDALVADAVAAYRLYVPAGVSEVNGALVTRSFDKASGLAVNGVDTDSDFSISVNPVLDAPELVLSGLKTAAGGEVYVVIQEDQAIAKKIGVLSFSPDPMEYATVDLHLSAGFVAAGGTLALSPLPAGITWTEDAVTGAYSIIWDNAEVGDLIPRSDIQVQIIPGTDYFNTDEPSDQLADAVADIADVLTINATSRFDNDRLSAGRDLDEPITVKLLVREANDNPLLAENLQADAFEAVVWERLEANEGDGLAQVGGNVYGYTDADVGDSHAVSPDFSSRREQLLAGDSPKTFARDPVLLTRAYWESSTIGSLSSYAANVAKAAGLIAMSQPDGAAASEGAVVTSDGYEIVLNYAEGADYWYFPGMLGILKTRVDSDSGEVQWEVVVAESELNFLSVGETLVQEYQLVLADYRTAGDVDSDKLGRLYTDVSVTIQGRNDVPEFVDAFGLSGEKTSTDVFGANGLTDEGQSQASVSLFFVDPDVSQSEANYTAAWVDGSVVFATSGLVVDRLFSGASQKLLGGNLDVVYAGEYAVASQGIRESIYEIQGVLPQANTLIAYKTASEEMTLEVSVSLAEVSSGATTEASLTLTFDNVILPNFELLFSSSVDDTAASEYRQTIFYGNDFSEYEASNADITQIAPEYGQVVSTFLSPDDEVSLHGRDIAGRLDAAFDTETTETQPFSSSNIYGTSGRDIILATGEGGSLLYGGDETAHDVMIGSKGNDLFVLGGGVDYVAGSQVPVFVHDEDIYVVSSLIDYAEMEVAGMTDLLGVYFSSNAEKMAAEIAAHVNALGVDNAYVVGIIEDLALSPVDSGYEAIDRVYFDGFAALTSGELDQQVLTTGEVLLTQTFTSSAGETEAFSLLLSMSDTTYDYENAIFIS